MSSRDRNPQVPIENRRRILGNQQNKQVERVTEVSPERSEVAPVAASLIQTKQKDNNIGRVNTPELRVGDNNKSQDLPFDDNTPKTGQKPFTQTQLTPLRTEPQVPVIGQNVGFQYPRGNFFISPDDSLPEADVFAPSQQVDIAKGKGPETEVTGNRPRNFQDFFN